MKREKGCLVALTGNPNVGKSTVFNALTGMRQHTGNWPGKTVARAEGSFTKNGRTIRLVDLPGTYSLSAHSPEEEITVDFIQKEHPDAVIVICDSSSPERGISLLLQILEITSRVVLCANLSDEAKKRGVILQKETLSFLLGVPVVVTDARSKKGLDQLIEAVFLAAQSPPQSVLHPSYPPQVRAALDALTPLLAETCGKAARHYAIRSLCSPQEAACSALPSQAQKILSRLQKAPDFAVLSEQTAAAPVHTAERVSKLAVIHRTAGPNRKDALLDRIFTGKVSGILCMLLLLFLILWITISGANAVSDLLSNFLFSLESPLANMLAAAGLPQSVCSLLTQGVYRVLAWVVSVMLPPMAIFFPLFTLLEDFGYLPRVAFNLDAAFQKAKTCGKQALTICMGFGCNAVGITGCRIIDSPRERSIARVTNCLTPCNGRFPFLISVFTLFFLSGQKGFASSLGAAGGLCAVILLGISMTFLTSALLSKTLYKGLPSAFALELPPYRRPQIGKVIVRSVFDRTIFVLGRAVVSAIPAGFLIWLAANIEIGGVTLLHSITSFFDPLGRLLGMDGVILTAFILGFPANEIVMPIIIMAYTASGSLSAVEGAGLYALLLQNGWTPVTAVCVLLFSLMHWPCAASCFTLYKESKSLRETLTGILLPTLCGALCCIVVSAIGRLFF